MTGRGGERGSVAAEFAVVLPAVVLVILLAVGMLSAIGTQVRLEQAVAQAARLAGRDEPAGRVTGAATRLVPGASVAVSESGDLVCVRATVASALPFATLSARSCALAGGW